MKRSICYFLLLFFSFYLFNCSQPVELEKPVTNEDVPSQIPSFIIQKANNYIISKTSQNYFDKLIKFDPASSWFSPADSYCISHPNSCAGYLLNPYYSLTYNFNLTEVEGFSGFIHFVMDTCGKVVPEIQPYGIPKCPNNDCWDNFHVITKERAIEIAKQKGLEAGIKNWTVKFHFYAGTFNNYVWEISNTLYVGEGNASGKGILLNAIDGTVFMEFGWDAVS